MKLMFKIDDLVVFDVKPRWSRRRSSKHSVVLANLSYIHYIHYTFIELALKIKQFKTGSSNFIYFSTAKNTYTFYYRLSEAAGKVCCNSC